MTECVIACSTLKGELGLAFARLGREWPVRWVPSGYHDFPKKLHALLQEELDNVQADRVLMAFGLCGNAVSGLQSRDFELILPRTDDCISMLIGSVQARADYGREHAAYYLTQGWLSGERNIWTEYQYTRQKYGDEQADAILKMMFGHYRTLGLLDTGAYPMEDLYRQSAPIAEAFGFAQETVPAGIGWLENLLTGPWPEARFIRLAPNRTMTGDLLLL